MRRNVLILIAALVFVAIAFFLLRDDWLGSPDETPSTEVTPGATPPERPSPAVVPHEPGDAPGAEPLPMPDPEPEPIPLPSLEESDPFVRERLEAFDLPAEWTAQDGLVRRFAVLTDAVTRGEWPRRPLRFLQSPGEFRVVERDGTLYPDPNNPMRFDAAMTLLESIDPATAADFLSLIDPLVIAALGELGLPTDGPDPILEAIDAVRESPEVAGELELVRPKVFYEYEDPALEALPAFDKQLIRLGPKNVARLKAYLSLLRDEIDGADE